MKQEIITYLSTIKEDLFNLSQYLYNNPEESFKEYKCYNYIINMLKKYNFKVEEKYLGISTCFYSEIGSGYPKICYLCEYDADPNHGHISGNNLVSTMSIGAAIALSKVLDKTGGTVIILGCAGEYINGSKTTMVKQGVFKDIDIALIAHPNVVTTKTFKSKAMLPLRVKFSIPKNRDFSLSPCITTHCGILTYNFTDLLKENLPKSYDIQLINSRGICNPYIISSEHQMDYLITCDTIDDSHKITDFIKSYVSCLGNIFDVDTEVTLHALPFEEMIPNETLCRIFSHNLKEAGIINIEDFSQNMPGLSLGSVSHVVPCINPFIKITEKANIPYPSSKFAMETIKDFALEQSMKATTALALTGLDIIESKNLLSEVKEEFRELPPR